jgi:phage terminase large subunit-like protein
MRHLSAEETAHPRRKSGRISSSKLRWKTQTPRYSASVRPQRYPSGSNNLPFMTGLPAEFKSKQTSSNTYISYKRKTGFTDSSLILPNGSRISFKTYSQYANNPTILEGAELGSFEAKWLNIGVWLDEYLGGPEIIETLRFRLATRNSKMILTFTPIFGMTDVVKQYVDNAKVLESREAELLDGERIPTILECKTSMARCITSGRRITLGLATSAYGTR